MEIWVQPTMTSKTNKPVKAKLLPDDPFFPLIQDAYRVFKRPKPSNIEVCEGCCMEPDIEADFFHPPIQELPLHYLQDWYFAASDPGGIAKNTWAYLLPRVLEVLACGEEVSSVGIEVSLSRYPTGQARNWSSEEWRVLDDFQKRFLLKAIEGGSEECLDDTLCMFRLGGWPMDGLLAQVAAAKTATLAERFWQDWCYGYAPSVWITAFWESPDGTAAFDFYTSEVMYRRMQQLAFDDGTPPELSEKALMVAEVIEANATWNQPDQ
ncbi:hypothetical protein [Ruegeria faecimaris]|uniref:hypothetical protein n=2 Tax=Ruegeria faecimaris TaxID=686389 RepID=UPI0024933DB1|nr:hypothetical protein [Ruegeria faecimaris]